MAEYFTPGVYIEEFDSAGQPLSGVSTSIAGFVGLAELGSTTGLPTLVTSMNDFKRNFGGYLSQNQFGNYRYLAYSVEQFFVNGGSQAYIVRVAPEDAKAAKANSDVLHVSAKNVGAWGNQIAISVEKATKAKSAIVSDLGNNQYVLKNSGGFYAGDEVVFSSEEGIQKTVVVSVRDQVIELADALNGEVTTEPGTVPTRILSTVEFSLFAAYGAVAEKFDNLSLNVESPHFVTKVLAKSQLVDVNVNEGTVSDLLGDSNERTITLSGGSDGSLDQVSAGTFIGENNGPGKRTGIQSFIDNDSVSLMAVPGVTIPAVQLALVAHCEGLGSRFAILDIPREKTSVQEVLEHRELFDSSYAALYNPWVQVFDPAEKRNVYIPPSGSVAGVFARSDSSRGIEKAPANEVLRGVTGLDVQYNRGEQDLLNPKGVNLIRSFTGQGIRIWGARTTSSNSLWKYINVRRLFIFIEESIKQGTNWVVFEPNDERLWARVHRTIDAFLTRVWRGGALQGSSPNEAFYIDISSNTMSQDDIDNGRLVCVIGIAPVKPAEFVVFRITQKTNEQ